MKKLIYPAIFHKEDNAYWVEFPDLEGCQSFADTLEEIYFNAKEALTGYCDVLLEDGRKLPAPSDICKIPKEDDTFVSLVEVNVLQAGKAIKKTLTIPSWLNDAAVAKSINFSQTLQNALLEQLNLSNA